MPLVSLKMNCYQESRKLFGTPTLRCGQIGPLPGSPQSHEQLSAIDATAEAPIAPPGPSTAARSGLPERSQPFEGVQSCVRAQSYAGCKRIGSWCRLRKLGCSGIYVEYDRFGVLVNDDSLLLAALAPRIIRKR